MHLRLINKQLSSMTKHFTPETGQNAGANDECDDKMEAEDQHVMEGGLCDGL